VQTQPFDTCARLPFYIGTLIDKSGNERPEFGRAKALRGICSPRVAEPDALGAEDIDHRPLICGIIPSEIRSRAPISSEHAVACRWRSTVAICCPTAMAEVRPSSARSP